MTLSKALYFRIWMTPTTNLTPWLKLSTDAAWHQGRRHWNRLFFLVNYWLSWRRSTEFFVHSNFTTSILLYICIFAFSPALCNIWLTCKGHSWIPANHPVASLKHEHFQTFDRHAFPVRPVPNLVHLILGQFWWLNGCSGRLRTFELDFLHLPPQQPLSEHLIK